MRALFQRWWYSAVLGILYLCLGYAWPQATREQVMASGLLSALFLLVLLVAAADGNYFSGRLDVFLHCVVIVDVLLEALVVDAHPAGGFYLCAAAFAVVIGGYRFYAFRKCRGKTTNQTNS